MENLIFSLNATLPIFFTMILGWFFRKVGLMDEAFVKKMNKFVFQAALPALLFQDLATVNFFEVWDTTFVLFCFSATLISILGVTALSFFLKDKSIQGEFIQASYRSSAAILGIAFIQNIYGNAGMAPLMIIATVPLYNVMAVVVLSLMKPQREPLNRQLLLKTLKGILTNPIILGIVAGMLWSLLKLPVPVILEKTVKNVAVLATPLGLMAMGASFEVKQASSRLKPAIVASVIKLVVLVAIFLPIAVHLGFRQEKLIAILVMLGSCTTVSCYIMAKNMGHEGILTSSTVMLTTLFSAFTLTGWLYLLRSLAFI
ncbi:MAG: AEC family transporter [Lachnospiraceae bacterium]|nr:AEC family transporter [Robinsoniella sp.]MDY3766523.1 AEC family transporter [Lachnospiraceae bacterium]